MTEEQIKKEIIDQEVDYFGEKIMKIFIEYYEDQSRSNIDTRVLAIVRNLSGMLEQLLETTQAPKSVLENALYKPYVKLLNQLKKKHTLN
jgi:hypothetical protein